MAQLLKLKRSSVSGKVPTISNLEAGELAINTADGKLFFERDDSTVQGIFTTNALTTGSLWQSGSDSYFLSNVGIKTTNPSRALEVRGMVVISGSYENLADPSYAGLLFNNPQDNTSGLIRKQDSVGGFIISATDCIIIKPNAAPTHTGVNTAVFCTGSTTFNTDVRIPDNNLHITGSIFLSGSMLTNVVGSSTSPVGGVFVGGESEEGITFVTGTTSSLYTDSEGLVFDGKPVAYATGSPGYLAVFETQRQVTGSVVFQNNGSIGIGNTSPGAKLDITGDLKVGTISAAATDTDTFLVSDSGLVKSRTGAQVLSDIGAQPAGNYVIDNGGAAGQLGVWSSGTELSGSNGLYWSGTNLGVGTASPAYKLDVKSEGANTFFTSFTPSAGSGFIRVYQDSNNHLSLYGANASGTTNVVLSTNGVSYLKGGNVIIGGSADNGNTLQVQGNSYINGVLTVQGNISASGNLDVDGSITGSSLQIAGINYPTTDGTLNQAIVTDGAGNLSFGSVAAASATNTIITVKNVSGGTIEKGTPLYVTGSGTSGNVAGVWPADAGNRLRMPALAVAGEQLLDGAEGVGLLDGYIAGVDTSLFQSGDEVFVAVGGGYTNVAPTGSTALIQKLGNVEKVHASNGSGVINGPNAARSLPNWETGKVMVGSPTYPVTSSFTYFDESNARLGIGTTSPSTKLDVAGDQIRLVKSSNDAIIQVSNTTGNAGSYFVANSGFSGYTGLELQTLGTGEWYLGNYGYTDFSITDGSRSSGTRVFTIQNTTGNVGIGTTAPDYKLDVAGTVQIQDSLYLGKADIASGHINAYELMTFNIDTDNDDADTRYFGWYKNGAAGSGTALMRLTETGNLGIGTTNPAVKLHLGNDSNTTPSTLRIDSTTTADAAAQFAHNGTIEWTIGSDETTGTTNTRAFVISKGSTLGTNDYLFISASGNVGIGTNTPGSALAIGSVFTFNTTTDLFQINNDTNTGGINLSGNNSRIYFGGNRAIEGAQNGSNLTIGEGYGQVTLADNTVITGDLTVTGIVTAQEFHTEFVSASIIYQSGSTKFGDTTDDIHQFTGSVNITGSITSIGLATFIGTTNIGGTNWLQFNGYNTVLGEGTNTYLQANGGGSIIFRNNTPSTLMTLTNGGNLGIGTSSPAKKLVVAGATSELQLYSDSDISTIDSRALGNTGDKWLSINPSGGNVGIGTTSPSQKLEVSGNAKVTGVVYTDVVATNSGTAIDFRDQAAASIMYLDAPNKRVGIGTTSPGAKLHVSGSARINGTIYSGDGSISANNSLQLQYDAASGDGVLSALSTGGNTTLALQTANSGTTATKLYLSSGGSVRLNFYGSGTFTGTQAYGLGVDSSGNIIETNPSIDGLGQANYITRWVDADTLTTSSIYETGGNIGIGTTSPGYKLQVAGTARVDSNFYVNNGSGTAIVNAYSGGSIGTYLAKASSATANFTTSGVSYPRGLGFGAIIGQGNTTDIPVNNSSWNGGYGGNIGFWSDIHYGAEAGTNSIGYNAVIKGTGSSNSYGFFADLSGATDGTRYGIYTKGEQYNYFSGSVGIGTTSPSNKLYVSDTVADYVAVIENLGTGTDKKGLWIKSDSSWTNATLLKVTGGTTDTEVLQANTDQVRIGAGSISQTDGKLYVTGTDATLANFVANSSSALFISGSGNVGIGTTSPTGTYGKLTVNGSISLLDDQNTKLEIGRYSSGASNSYIKLGSNSNSLRITNNSDSADIFTIENNGNVGIGTTSPSYTLDVYDGNIGSSTSNLILTSTNYNTYIRSNASYSTIINDTTSGNVQMVNGGGKVGIGTTAPLRKLHVVGDFAVNASGSQYYGVYINGAGEGADPNILIGDWHNASANLTWDSSARALIIDTQYSTGAGTFKITGNDQASTFLTIDNQGDVTINNDLTVDGIITAKEFHTTFVSASIVYQSGSTKFGDSADDVHQFTGSIDVSGSYNLLSRQVLYDINGTGDIYANVRLLRNLHQSDGMYIGYNSAGTTGAHLRFYANATNERMRIDASTGNVGIGTTSPSYALDIERTTGEVAIQLQARDNSSNTAIYFGDNDDADVGSLIYNQGSNYMSFTTNTGERMRITSAGNVGIGTTSPDHALDVNGNIRVQGGNRKLIFNNGSVEASLDQVTGASAGLFTLANVGIGTTTPSYKLHVDANTSALFRVSNGAPLTYFQTSYYGYASSYEVAQIGDWYGKNSSGVAVAIGIDPKLITGGSFFGNEIALPDFTEFITANAPSGSATDWNQNVLVISGSNIGIGTATVADKLTVAGNISIGSTYKLYNGAAADSAGITFPGSYTRIDGFYGITFNSSTTNVGSQTERMRITNAGDVAIGTTSPQARFEVNVASTGSASDGIALRYGANQVHYWNLEDQWTSRFQIGSTAGNWKWENSGGTRMVIKSDGKVGIGIASPTYKLDVYGDIRTGGADPVVMLQPDSGTYAFLQKLSTSNGDYLRLYDGTNYSMFWTGSNVGIGTTTPTAKLEIAGFSTGAGLKLNYGNSSGTIEAVNFIANGGANGVIGMQMVSAGVGDLWLGGSGGRSLTLYRDGNVGIGKDSPDYKLDVLSGDGPTTARFANSDGEDTLVRIIAGNYNTELDARLFIGEADTYGMTFEYDGVANMGYIGMNDNVDPTGAYSKRIAMPRGNTNTYFPAGNVGIGISTPSERLHVSGAVIIDGATGDSSTDSVLYVTKANNNDWTIYANASGLDYGIYTRVAPTANYAIGVHDGTGFVHRVTGAGDAFFSGDVTVDGIVTAREFHTQFVSASIVYQSGSTQFGNSDDDTHIFSGSVEVISSDNVLISAISTDAGAKIKLADPDSDVFIQNQSKLLSLGFASTQNGQILHISSSGNVGIGTTSPSSKLHVKGTWVTNEGILAIDADSGTRYSGLTMQNNGTAYGYLYHDNTDKYVDLYASTATGLRFSTADTTRMVVTSSGSVGIGTTSPSDILHVRKSGADTRMIVGNNTTYDQFIYFQGNTDWSIGIDYSNSNAFTLSNYSTIGTNDRITVTTAGNVGIGTTSPTNTLDVLGGATIRNSSGGGAINVGTSSGRTQYQYVTLGGGTGGTDYGWQVGRSPQTGGIIDDGFYIYDIKTNNTPFAIALGGNVGIGTTSPNQKLVVAGSIAVSGSNTEGAVWLGDGQSIGLYRNNNYDLVLSQEASSGNPLYLSGAGDVVISIDNNNNENNRKFIVGNNAVKSTNELFSVNEGGDAYVSRDLAVSGSLTVHANSTGNAFVLSYQDQVKKVWTKTMNFTFTGAGVYYFNLAFPSAGAFHYKLTGITGRNGSYRNFGTLLDSSYIYWETDNDFTHRAAGDVHLVSSLDGGLYFSEDITSYGANNTTDTSAGTVNYSYYIVRYPIYIPNGLTGNDGTFQLHLETYGYPTTSAPLFINT